MRQRLSVSDEEIAMPGQAWTQEELDSLLRQVIAEQKPLPKLSVLGKTTAAINNQRRRLKEAGLLENSFTGLRHVPWTIRDLRQLAHLTGEHGFSAAFIAQLQLIPGRSRHAISKMMGRHGLGNPAIKSRARNARRLTAEKRRDLERFLREEGRFWPSAAVARQWGLAARTMACVWNCHSRNCRNGHRLPQVGHGVDGSDDSCVDAIAVSINLGQ